MNNNDALVVLSDAIDLQRETVELLRESLRALHTALEELKATRVPNYTQPSTVPPYTSPFTPTPWTNPIPWNPNIPTITNKSDYSTCEAKNAGVFYSQEGICGPNF